MAGPGASVLFRSPIEPELERRIRAEIFSLATRVEGNDFWLDDELEGGPFILWIGEEYPGELADMVSNGLAITLGWEPRGVVGFAAMCNRSVDHKLLAQLCIRLARNLDGIIDFNGQLCLGPHLTGPSRRTPIMLSSGTLWAVTYEIDDERFGIAHYGDPTFLEAWLREPEFRMIK